MRIPRATALQLMNMRIQDPEIHVLRFPEKISNMPVKYDEPHMHSFNEKTNTK